MFMLPQPNFGLLPKPVAEALENPNSPLRSPYDYYPREFKLDQFETLGYNKRAMIDFLKQDEVVRVYESIPKEKYTRA
jgi:5'-3' exonuclease